MSTALSGEEALFADALAMMEHPNIAKVHDAGSTDQGRPFFVMEYVPGIPITKFCDENHLAPAGRPPLDPKAFARAGIEEIRHDIRDDRMPTPSARWRTLANGLAADIQRHLRHEPMVARPFTTNVTLRAGPKPRRGRPRSATNRKPSCGPQTKST